MSDRRRICGLTEKECKKLQHYFLLQQNVNVDGKQEFTCSTCEMDSLLKSPATIVNIKRNPTQIKDILNRIKEPDIIKKANASPKCPILGVRIATVCRFKACPYHIKHNHVFYKNCMIAAAEHAKNQPKGLGDVDIAQLLNIPVVIVKEMLNKAYNSIRRERLIEYLSDNMSHLYRRLMQEKICVVCGRKHENWKTCSKMSRTSRVVCNTECVKPPQWVIDLEEAYDDEFMVLYYAAHTVFNGDLNVIAPLFKTNARSLRAHLLKLKSKGGHNVRTKVRQTA